VLSDFLAPLERLEPDLVSLAASGHEVLVFQILDPAELTFNFPDASMFQDVESGRTLFIDPATARKETADFSLRPFSRLNWSGCQDRNPSAHSSRRASLLDKAARYKSPKRVPSKAGRGGFCAKPGIFARQTCTQPGARASTGALCVACARSGR